MDLYQKEKYKVFLGKGEHIGFCTVWNDPEIILRAEPSILDHVAILGTLYSREGVNIILRNLCLNPQITHILVWGRGNLSNTPIGSAGKNSLDTLWKEGTNEDGAIPSTGFRMHPMIDKEVVKTVTRNVQIIDVSELTLPQVLEKIKEIHSQKNDIPQYMASTPFPEFKRSEDATFPSEEVGFVARGKKVTDAWIRVVDRIMRYGTIKPTEYGNKQRELQVMTWVIEDEDAANPCIPDWNEEVKKAVGLDKKSLDKYISTIFFEPTLPEGVSYTYGNRLLAFLPGEEKQTLNQTQFMIDKITECESSRRAVAVLINPETDEKSKSPPCLTHLQVLVNNGHLNMFVVYRSHDIFKAGISNAFGLRALQAHIARQTNLKVGKLAITSNSAHIYEEDWENAKSLCMCQVWERPPAQFDENNDLDPRAMVQIRISGSLLIIDILSPAGELLLTVDGVSAKEVVRKLAKLDLFSRPDHWADIGMELQKAEIAKQLGKEYHEDQPLKF